MCKYLKNVIFESSGGSRVGLFEFKMLIATQQRVEKVKIGQSEKGIISLNF